MDAQPDKARVAVAADVDADTDPGADRTGDGSADTAGSGGRESAATGESPDGAGGPGTAGEVDDAEGAGDSDGPAESTGGESGDGTIPGGRSRRRARDPLVLAALALLAVAAVSAVWFGWSWWRAAHDDALRFSQTRDEVLQAGEQAVQNLNTLDYRNADQGLRIWEQSTTGTLHDQLTQGAADFLTRVRQAKTVTSARILDGAVVDINDRTGKASVIVAVEVTVTDANGRHAAKRERLQGELVRTGSGWKLAAVGQVPVAATG